MKTKAGVYAGRLLITACAVIVILALLIGLAGCGLLPATRTVVKPQIVEVPKYIRAPLPAQLPKEPPCTVVEPDPACQRQAPDGTWVREFCGEQLLGMRARYRYVLRACAADDRAVRALSPADGN